MPPAEAVHADGTDAGGLLGSRVVGQEVERDVAVQGGEQVQRCWMVGIQDGAQPVLGGLLSDHHTVAVTRDRTQLGQLWRRRT